MSVPVIHETDVDEIELPGRKFRWLVAEDRIRAEHCSTSVIRVAPGDKVRPAHRHPHSEEVIYILSGSGRSTAKWRQCARARTPRGGVVRIAPDGSQQIIMQKRSQHFDEAASEANRYLTGTLPNGLAFAANGDILISNFGTDCLEIMRRDRSTRILADSIDGEPIGKVNFVLRDSRVRIWITVSTRIKNWMHALRTDLADGYIALYEAGKFRIVADGFHFTNEIRFDAAEEFLYVVETTGGCISRCTWAIRAT